MNQPPFLSYIPEASTSASRKREVENALLVQALCGRPASAAARARLRRYETGELSREQAFAELYCGRE